MRVSELAEPAVQPLAPTGDDYRTFDRSDNKQKTAENFDNRDKLNAEDEPLFPSNPSSEQIELPASPKLQATPPAAAPEPSTVMPTLLVLSASCLFSGMHTCVRYVTVAHGVSPLFVAFFRGVIQTVCAIALILTNARQVLSPPPTTLLMTLLCARGLLGAVSILSKFTALSLIPVAVAASLFSTTPIFAVLLARIFLQERLKGIDRVALGITTVASVLIASTESSVAGLASVHREHILGVVLGLNGAVVTGLVFVLMRYMGTRVHFMLSVLVMGLGSASAALGLHFASTRSLSATAEFIVHPLLTTKGTGWLGLAGAATFGFGAALCLNRGTQLLAAGRSGLLRTFDIPVNFLVGFLFLGEFPSAPGQLIGCALITLSTLLLATKGLS